MTDTSRTPAAWTLEVAYDAAVQIDAAAEGFAGAARLEFADGSFVEIDPVDLARVLRICAMPTQTGWWLLRVTIGAEVADAAESGRLPEYGRLTMTDAPAELATLARAALIDHLAGHDRPSRRAIWGVELLATLSGICTVDVDAHRRQLHDLPAGIDVGELADAAFGHVTRLHAVAAKQLERLCRDATHCAEVIGDFAAAKRLRNVATSAANLADPSGSIEHFEHQITPFESIVPETSMSSLDDTWLAADFLGATGFQDVGERGAGYEIKCDIDLRQLDTLELGPESEVVISVRDSEWTITVDQVQQAAAEQIFLRVFDPHADGPTSAKLLYLAPVEFNPATRMLIARVELTPAALSRVSGVLLAQFVDSASPTNEFPSHFQYWAGVTASQFARLVLAVIEQSAHVSAAVQLRREAVERAAYEAGGTERAAEAGRAATRVTAPDFAGSLRFITPSLLQKA